MQRIYCDALTGGAANALDGVDPTDVVGNLTSVALAAGWIAEVNEATVVSLYVARESAGAVEDAPRIIVPDVNPGNFWWELIKRSPRIESMTKVLIYANIPGGL